MPKWSDAENCWRKLSNWEKVALACENQEKWIEAAKTYEELSNFENAARCYTNLENWAEVERCWRNLSNWEKVAVACENQEKWLDAAIEWKKVSNFEKAADNYCRIDSYKEAVRCMLEIENWQRIEEIYRKSSTVSKFADLCESRENWKTLEKVLIEIYGNKGWKWISVNDGVRLATVQEKQGKYFEAATSWEMFARDLHRAIEIWRKIEDWNSVLRLVPEIVDSQRRLEYKNIAESGLARRNEELKKAEKEEEIIEQYLDRTEEYSCQEEYSSQDDQDDEPMISESDEADSIDLDAFEEFFSDV